MSLLYTYVVHIVHAGWSPFDSYLFCISTITLIGNQCNADAMQCITQHILIAVPNYFACTQCVCVCMRVCIGYGNVVPTTVAGRLVLFIYFPLGFAAVAATLSLIWKVVINILKRTRRMPLRTRIAMLAAHVSLCKSHKRIKKTVDTLTNKYDVPLNHIIVGKVYNLDNDSAAAAAAGESDKKDVNGTHGEVRHSSSLPMDDAGVMGLPSLDSATAAAHQQSLHHVDTASSSKSAVAATITSSPLNDFIVSVIVILLWMFIFTVIYSLLEGWDLFTSFYFVYTTLTTLGFGDFLPRSSTTVHTFIYFIMIGLAGWTFILSSISAAITTHIIQARRLSPIEPKHQNTAPTAAPSVRSQLLTTIDINGVPLDELSAPVTDVDAATSSMPTRGTNDVKKDTLTAEQLENHFDADDYSMRRAHKNNDDINLAADADTEIEGFCAAFSNHLKCHRNKYDTDALRLHQHILASMRKLSNALNSDDSAEIR